LSVPANTTELGEVRLRLRDDLQFTPQQYGGLTCYVVEEPISSQFYRIGIPEYTFISLLDGQTTLHEAIGQAAAALGQDAFSEQQAAAICKWLIDCQLATTDQSVDIARLLDISDRAARQSRWQWVNPLLIKIPLGNPEPLLERLTPWLGWLASGPMFIVWLVVCGIALYLLSGRWDELSLEANLVLSGGNWLWLAVTWLVLKFMHELAHALVCRRFGGTVREAGLVFILFGPIPYVDVTSAWRFPSK
jgi:putative peptide zinc metalloprotease protein